MNREMMDLVQARHSVRQYTTDIIETEKRDVLNKLICECNQKSGLNIQIFYDEPDCFNSAMAHYGKFENVTDYIALVGEKSAHLDEDAGYYGEKLVLQAQALGLNTCWVALTHGKSKVVIGRGEKQVCLIALGYGKTQGVLSRSKDMRALSDMDETAPDWYVSGVEAALLAPTAVNQQKFYFTRNGDQVFLKVKGIGTLTRVDLGIVKYHFEAVSGHKVES